MRYSPQHKGRTRARILAEAGRLVRRRGLTAATLDRVMAAAGLSHGGFYAHFSSKDDLTAATLEAAFAATRDDLFAGLDSAADADWVRQVLGRYLGRAHLDDIERGCPLAPVGGEAARADGDVRAAVAAGAAAYVDALSARIAPGAEQTPAERARAVVALMVGGVMLARLTADAGEADQTLRACRRAAQALTARGAA